MLRFRRGRRDRLFLMSAVIAFGVLACSTLFALLRRKEIARRVRAALDQVGLLGREMNSPLTLSAGEQQRVGIARAVATRPDLVIADEPTSSLDFDARERFVDLLFERLQETNATLVFVSHDPTLGAHFKRESGIDEFRAKAVA